MRFESLKLQNAETDAVISVFAPAPIESGWQEDKYSEFTNIYLGNKPISVPSYLVRKVIEFGLTKRQHKRRARMRHDCSVFALAVESGDSLKKVSFAPRFHRGVQADYDSDIAREDNLPDPRLNPGEIAFIGKRLEKTAQFIPRHLLVRAGQDEHSPIYFSKLSHEGPVVAHRLEDTVDFYPLEITGQAKNLRIERIVQ